MDDRAIDGALANPGSRRRDGSDRAAVTLFHSLADPARLAIIQLLSDGEKRVVDLTGGLGLAQSTVSGHLAALRAAGLVDAHPHGRATYYALVRPELWELLAAAQKVLAATSSTSARRPHPEPGHPSIANRPGRRH